MALAENDVESDYDSDESVSSNVTNNSNTAHNSYTTVGRYTNVVERLENEDVKNYNEYVIRNAPGADWDIFTFLDVEFGGELQKKAATLCLAGQVKKTSLESLQSMVINDKSFAKEYDQVMLVIILSGEHIGFNYQLIDPRTIGLQSYVENPREQMGSSFPNGR